MEVIGQIHSYMEQTPQSELHRLGKMFGVLVIRDENGGFGYLKAFSSLLDGKHTIDGFVPPIFDFAEPDGYFRQEEASISSINTQLKHLSASDPATQNRRNGLLQLRKTKSRALQRWLFSQYNVLSGIGKTRNLVDIFAQETPILSAEEYFSPIRNNTPSTLPPAGAGECCAPKLLQFAFLHHLAPLALAEFWIGAPPLNELRRDGYFYGACLGKCRPILNHMLQGIDVQEEPLPPFQREKIDILYQDEWLIIAMKPAGMLTTAGNNGSLSLEEYLRQSLKTPLQAVHRLDQDTSGLVVLAKTQEAYRRMQALFRTREVKKRYEAVIECDPDSLPPAQGEITLPLLPNPLDRPRQIVDYEHGKPSYTKYNIRSQLSPSRFLVDLYPLTGRTHQLRVHCAHFNGLNAPILGDRLYGKPADRLYLHAAELQFTHPFTHILLSPKVTLEISF